MFVREMTEMEQMEMNVNGWTCTRCAETATQRIVGPGAFRLCDQHANEVRERISA